MNSPIYRLRLLGGASIERAEGTPLAGPAAQRHRIALLALLACASMRGREKLMTLLWPERDAERARNLLNVAVYSLRKTLGDEAIQSAGEELRLNPEVVRSDVVDFRAALERGDHETAVALYGGPLLDGFFVDDAPELERWIDGERERLATSYARALEALARAAEKRRDFGASSEWWRRRAAHDPYDSRVTEALMRSLEASGNRAAALQHATAHERLLRDELGIAPSAEVASLVARMRTLPAADQPETDPIGARAAVAIAEPVEQTANPLTPRHAGVQPGVPVAAELDVRESSGRRRTRRLAVAFPMAALVAIAAALTWRAQPSAVERERSVAVLPFVNMSAESANEYFSDGVTEEIITRLSAEPGLKVISRTSAMRYKGSMAPLRQIATELGVAHVLEGSVRREGAKVRITVQLIDARSDAHLWAETFDRELGDMFLVQDEIAREVERALAIRLADKGATVKRGTRDAEAYEHYLRARWLWHRRTREGHLQAAAHFREAIARDSTYADAWSGLSDTYLTAYQANYFGFADPERETFALMRSAAERAVTLDPQAAEAHTSLATVRWWQEDFPGAERELRRAIALNPSYALPRSWLAILLAGTGRAEEALRESRLGVELDPFATVATQNYAGSYLMTRQWERCIEQARRGFEIDPGSAELHEIVGACLALSGRAEEALPELRAAIAANGQMLELHAMLAWAQALAGHRDDARVTLRAAEAMPRGPNDIGIAFAIGRAFVALGDRDSAFTWLDRAAWKWPHLNNLYDPALDPIRADPRFALLAARVARELGLH